MIVLGIIGLISDMTIPTLVQNTRNKVTVVKLKKFHSTMENTFRLAVNENGTPDLWGATFDQDKTEGGDATNPDYQESQKNSSALYASFFRPYLNVIQDCSVNACKIGTEDLPGLLLADGSFVYFEAHWGDCSGVFGPTPTLSHVCALLSVFTDPKSKNQSGKNVFMFYLTKNGVIPVGSQQDTRFSFKNNCKSETTYPYVGCTAWVINNENMDYFKCSGLDWGGKTTCN